MIKKIYIICNESFLIQASKNILNISMKSRISEQLKKKPETLSQSPNIKFMRCIRTYSWCIYAWFPTYVDFSKLYNFSEYLMLDSYA